MRGTDHQQSHMFSYLSPEARVRKDHPLRVIRIMVDEVLRALSPQFDRMYASEGRPSIAPEKLLRAQLLQMLYSIRSERLLMEEIDYSVLFRWFVGLNLDEEVWDPTVFTKNPGPAAGSRTPAHDLLLQKADILTCSLQKRRSNSSNVLGQSSSMAPNATSCALSVPEILATFIPEILARLKTSRSVRKLPVLQLCQERREEDVGDAKTTRSRDIAESTSERGFPALGTTHRGREFSRTRRRCSRACQTTDRAAQHGREFPETDGRDSAGNAGSSLTGDSAASSGKRLFRR